MAVSSKTMCWPLLLLLLIAIFSFLFICRERFRSSSTFKLLENVSEDVAVPMKTTYNRSTPKSFICEDMILSTHVLPIDNPVLIQRVKQLQRYCSLVPMPRIHWKKAQRYVESDVAFLTFTGAKFYHSRTTAVRDTWASRVTNSYFVGETPYPSLPVTVIPDAGSDYLSNMGKHFHGLEVIYKDQQTKPKDKRQKWFFVAGDDAFINVQYIMKRLDPYDYTQPLLIGGHFGHEKCVDVSKNTTHKVKFPSGGAGFFLSAKLLELMQPELTYFLENVWPPKNSASDVALTCLAFQLGVQVTIVPGFWAHPPARTLALDGRENFHKDPEPNNYHYVTPDEMYLLDEFYIHQYLDRLINDADSVQLANFMRLFISSHYELLDKKRKECKLPTITEVNKP